MSKKWKPEYVGWSEGRVTLASCELSTHSTSRNEYAVMMEAAEDDDPYAGNAAIFWTDPQHLYLRYDWNQWYTVSNDNKDNCVNICKRNAATLMICTVSSVKYHAIRVYHIDKLPEELFGRQADEPSGTLTATQDVIGCDTASTPSSPGEGAKAPVYFLSTTDKFSMGADEEAMVEKQVDAFVEKTLPVDDEIQAAVDAEVELRGGRVWSRFRPGNNRLYSFDFVQIEKNFYVIVYSDFSDEWLADEEFFAEERPLWFSETDHRVSPVFQAMNCRDFFQRELPQIKIGAIVALPEQCIIINEDEMHGCWGEKCGTAVVRTKRISESLLQTLHEYLEAQPTDDANVPELDAIELVGISSRFTMNPENWIKN